MDKAQHRRASVGPEHWTGSQRAAQDLETVFEISRHMFPKAMPFSLNATLMDKLFTTPNVRD